MVEPPSGFFLKKSNADSCLLLREYGEEEVWAPPALSLPTQSRHLVSGVSPPDYYHSVSGPDQAVAQAPS